MELPTRALTPRARGLLWDLMNAIEEELDASIGEAPAPHSRPTLTVLR